MESVYGIFEGEKFISEGEVNLKKGQKSILTLLEDKISAEDEGRFLYSTAIKSGAFNYLFEEGEREYSIDYCKKI